MSAFTFCFSVAAREKSKEKVRVTESDCKTHKTKTSGNHMGHSTIFVGRRNKTRTTRKLLTAMSFIPWKPKFRSFPQQHKKTTPTKNQRQRPHYHKITTTTTKTNDDDDNNCNRSRNKISFVVVIHPDRYYCYSSTTQKILIYTNNGCDHFEWSAPPPQS